jgi:hypothetical protein
MRFRDVRERGRVMSHHGRFCCGSPLKLSAKALQKCGRYRTNSGQTTPSGLTSSAAFDPERTSDAYVHDRAYKAG